MSEEKKNAKLNEEELGKVSGGSPEKRYSGGSLVENSSCSLLADGNKCTCVLPSCPNNFVCGVFNESTYPKKGTVPLPDAQYL